MRITVDGIGYTVPDEVLQAKVTEINTKVLKMYTDLPLQTKLMIQMFVRGMLFKFAPTIEIPQEKGQDLIEAILAFVPILAPTGLEDIDIQITTSSEDNTFTITDINVNFSSKGQSR